MYAFWVYLIFDLGISPLNIKAKYTYNFEIKKFTVGNNNILEKIDLPFFFQLLVVMLIQSQIPGVYVWVCVHILHIYIHTYPQMFLNRCSLILYKNSEVLFGYESLFFLKIVTLYKDVFLRIQCLLEFFPDNLSKCVSQIFGESIIVSCVSCTPGFPSKQEIALSHCLSVF